MLASYEMPGNVVKFELRNKNERENQIKTRWEWSGSHNKNKCGKCVYKLKPDLRPSDKVKYMSRNENTILYSKFKRLLGAMDVKLAEQIFRLARY